MSERSAQAAMDRTTHLLSPGDHDDGPYAHHHDAAGTGGGRVGAGADDEATAYDAAFDASAPIDFTGLCFVPSQGDIVAETFTLIATGVAPIYSIYAAVVPGLSGVADPGADPDGAETLLYWVVYATTMVYAIFVLNLVCVRQAKRHAWYTLLRHGVLMRYSQRVARRSRVIVGSLTLGAATAAAAYNWSHAFAMPFIVAAQTLSFAAWYRHRLLNEDASLVTMHSFLSGDPERARGLVADRIVVASQEHCQDVVRSLEFEQRAAVKNGTPWRQRPRLPPRVFAARVRALASDRGGGLHPNVAKQGRCSRWVHKYFWAQSALYNSDRTADIMLGAFFQLLMGGGSGLFFLIQVMPAVRG